MFSLSAFIRGEPNIVHNVNGYLPRESLSLSVCSILNAEVLERKSSHLSKTVPSPSDTLSQSRIHTPYPKEFQGLSTPIAPISTIYSPSGAHRSQRAWQLSQVGSGTWNITQVRPNLWVQSRWLVEPRFNGNLPIRSPRTFHSQRSSEIGTKAIPDSQHRRERLSSNRVSAYIGPTLIHPR